ncbi:MAG: phosphoribosylglycinamide formyltransferase [Gammaproteobacteria bacterium]
MSRAAPRVAVLISGEGSNLQVLLDAARTGTLGAEIAVVISDRAAARGLVRARNAGVPARHLGGKGIPREAYDGTLAALLAEHSPDLLVLAGFMRIFSPGFVARFAGRILNIHPSLLPAYPGLDTHRRVLKAGERWHGATVHFVTVDLDAGPAALQYRLPVRADDTVESLTARVHVGEHLILPRAVEWFVGGRLRLENDSVMLDDRRLSQPVIMEE